MAKKKTQPAKIKGAVYKRVKIDTLLSNPVNSRIHDERDLPTLCASLEAFGQVETVCVQKSTGLIIGGNGRVQAMKSLGWTHVDIAEVDVTNKQAAALGIALNRTAELSAWDVDNVGKVLADLDLDDPVLQEMFAGLAHELELDKVEDASGGGDGFDATPKDGPTKAKVGDLWILGPHRLLVGDCTIEANVKRLFGDHQPFMMVTDPPYGVNYNTTWRHEAGVNKSIRVGKVMNDDRADWTPAWKLSGATVAYVWHGGLHSATVADSLIRAGFDMRAQIVWIKPRLVLSRGSYHWQHEPCFAAEKAHGEPLDDEGKEEPPAEGEEAWYAVRKGRTAAWSGGRKQTTVWRIGFAGEEKTFHGTQKPIECMAAPIRNHGKAGDVVYDPFMGSGTSLIAAHRLGRICLGCELDPAYADVIIARAEAEGLEVKRGK